MSPRSLDSKYAYPERKSILLMAAYHHDTLSTLGEFLIDI